MRTTKREEMIDRLMVVIDEACYQSIRTRLGPRLGLLWEALDALRMDFDRTGEHDRANSILAAQEHVEALQREVGGL